MKRRAVLFSLAATACSGDWAPSGQPPAPVPAPPPPAPAPIPPPAAAWSPGLITFNLGTSFDLATTLPASVKRGGVFTVSSTGAPLPPAIGLSPAGILTGTATATVAGVIFHYEEP